MTIPQGLGIRMDEGVRVGQKITPYYDPLLGKLITWGHDREIALNRMERALHEFHVSGIDTTIPFCKALISHPSFKKGKYSTHTLNALRNDLLKGINNNDSNIMLAARIGASKLHNKNKLQFISNQIPSNKWIDAGRKDSID